MKDEKGDNILHGHEHERTIRQQASRGRVVVDRREQFCDWSTLASNSERNAGTTEAMQCTKETNTRVKEGKQPHRAFSRAVCCKSQLPWKTKNQFSVAVVRSRIWRAAGTWCWLSPRFLSCSVPFFRRGGSLESIARRNSGSYVLRCKSALRCRYRRRQRSFLPTGADMLVQLPRTHFPVFGLCCSRRQGQIGERRSFSIWTTVPGSSHHMLMPFAFRATLPACGLLVQVSCGLADAW